MVPSGVKHIGVDIKKEKKQMKDGDFPYVTEFFKLLALCHTIVCDVDENTGEIKYSASSPDELALVQGAR